MTTPEERPAAGRVEPVDDFVAEQVPGGPAGQGQPGAGQEETARKRDWAEDAADARTADDPRARTPHDAAGVPSTGDRPTR